jgi:hypothetical protein
MPVAISHAHKHDTPDMGLSSLDHALDGSFFVQALIERVIVFG